MKFIVDLDFLDRCVLDRSIGTWNLESAAWLTPGLLLVKSQTSNIKNYPQIGFVMGWPTTYQQTDNSF